MKIIHYLLIISCIIFIIFLGKFLNLSNTRTQFKALLGSEIEKTTIESIYNQKIYNKFSDNKDYCIYIFATWCENCKSLIPKLQELTANKIKIYGLLINNPKNEKHVYFNKRNDPFSDIYIDKTNKLYGSLGIRAVPELIIIKDNKIKDRIIGRFDVKEVIANFN